MQAAKQDALNVITRLPDDTDMEEIMADDIHVLAVVHRRRDFRPDDLSRLIVENAGP